MKKRFFLALSIVFLGLSVLSDVDASMLGSQIVACQYPGSAPSPDCYYLWTDGNIHNTDWSLRFTLPENTKGINTFGYWYVGDSIFSPSGLSRSGSLVFQNGHSQFHFVLNNTYYVTTWLDTNSIIQTGIKDGVFDPWNGNLWYIYENGTSNVCSGNDNVKIFWIAGNGAICQKTDGTYSGNIVFIPANSQIAWNSYDGITNPYCWITPENEIGCERMTAPSGKWRDVSVSSNNYACAVEYSTNLVKCWNNSGTIISTSSGEAGGKPIPPPTPGTGFAKAGMSCVADRYPKIASTSWINPGFMNWEGTFTQTTYTGKSPYGCTGWLGNDCGDIIYGIGKSTDGVAVDYIKLYNFDAESVIRADSWKPPTVAVWPRSTLIADYHEPQILQIQAVRNGENYSANVYEFSNVANPSSVEPWANYFDDATKKWLPVYASGGLAKIPLSNWQTKLFLSLREFTVPPIGFRMGYSSEYYDQVSCSTPTNPCKMTLVGANWECRGGYANGYYGQCAYDTDGACSPIVSTGGTVSDGVPEEGAVVIKDSNWNVVSVRPKGSAIQDGNGIDANKVFSCPEYKGFLDIFPCAVTIAGNVVELISQSVTGADGNGGIQKIGTDIGSGATSTGGVSLTPVNPDSDNLADYMFRHSWNRATDSELATPFTNWGKFALYGALFVALLGVLATIAFVNRNR